MCEPCRRVAREVMGWVLRRAGEVIGGKHKEPRFTMMLVLKVIVVWWRRNEFMEVVWDNPSLWPDARSRSSASFGGSGDTGAPCRSRRLGAWAVPSPAPLEGSRFVLRPE